MWKAWSCRQLFFLFAVVLLLSGCGQSNESIVTFFNPIKDESLSGPFQYAAPWDADAFTSYVSEGESYQYAGGEFVYGGIVPHHLLAGYIPGAFFGTIADQRVDTIILISPNHFNRGIGPVATTYRHWETPFGQVETNREIVEALLETGLVQIEEGVIAEEHGIYSHMPFITKLLPKTDVVALTLPVGMGREELDTLVDALIEVQKFHKHTVVVGSVDFSHYQPLSVANFHDVLSQHVIEVGEREDVFDLEIDSPETVYAVLSLMQAQGTSHVAHVVSDNAANITGDPEVAETTSYISPYFILGESKKDEKLATMLHVGDMMLDRSVAVRMQQEGGFDWLLEPLAGPEERFFSGIDTIVGNLEGPLADVRIDTSKEIAFRFDPALKHDFVRWGFDVFTLANNHTVDMGYQGMRDTKRHLDDVGIAHLGEQYGLNSSSIYIDTVRGLDIAYVAINDTHYNIPIEDMVELVSEADTRADTVIVTIHWGTEYQPLSNSRQRDMARQFIDAGADAVIGHHPHVVQELEVYKERPIFYSLGNFLFDQYFSVPTQQGLVIGLVVGDDSIDSFSVFPVVSVRSQVDYMPYTMRLEFMEGLVERSRLGEYTIDNYSLDFSYARPTSS